MDMSRMLKNLVDLVVYFIGIVIGLRFLFRLVGANADNGFVNWVYTTSGEMLSPFRNIFVNPSVEGAGTVDFTALFGLIIYGLAGLLAVKLIDAWSTSR